MKHILAYGGYGIQNSGDDAPLIALMAHLRSSWDEEDFELGIISRHEDPLLCEWAGGVHIQNLEYPDRLAAKGRTFNGFSVGEDRAHMHSLMEDFEKADLLVLGAGNFLNDLAFGVLHGPLWHAAAMVFLAQLTNTPVFLYGPGVGPLVSSQAMNLAKWIVAGASKAIFRSGQAGPFTMHQQAVDPAFLLPAPKAQTRSSRLAFMLRSIEQFRLGADEEMRSVLGRFADANGRALSTYVHDDDRRFSKTSREHPLAHLDFLASRKACLTSRLHGAVYAVLAGCTPVAIDYFPKVGQFMRTSGLEHFNVPLDLLGNTDEVAALIEHALVHDAPPAPAPPIEYVASVADLLGLPIRRCWKDPVFPAYGQ